LRQFTWVDPTTHSWSPTALVLAVATSAHAGVDIPKDEGTLCRGLRTSPLPGTHASVGDCWQNSRCCHLLAKSNTVSATPSCRTRTVELPPGCYLSTYAERAADLRQGDSFAYASATGFPAQTFSWASLYS